jgi:hypothetical protein
MKKSFLLATAFALVFAVFPKQASAQKFQGQIVPHVGVGYSLTGILLGVISDGLNATGAVSSTKTPVLMGGGDVGLSDRFSIGLLYTYQGVTMKYNTYEVTDTAGNFVTVTGDFKDRLTRQSIGIRPLFHFGDNDDFDLYVGARFSYVFWNYSSDRVDVNVDELFKLLGSPVKPQAIFGMRYFVTENIGFGTEFAIGPTYFMSVGIAGRFGGN